ncbi:type IV pilus modification protein PilV [Herminiimonas sp. NPDC097707]|uniref:type IV pilus modification protein PilV n=1 Tax=Herminiimonas sp. NPDC097707 TaxID=3364007 RepID=UPI003839F4B1
MMTSGEHGFSMIEVLISVFVLTAGVIGGAGMQLTALRTAQQSALQTRALYLASDMADMMRANGAQMQRGDSENPYLQVDHKVSTTPHRLSDYSCYDADAHCDAEQLARFDIAQLLQQLDADFPGGRVRICRDALPWNAVAGRFAWECTATASSAASAPVVIKIGWQEKDRTGNALEDAAAAAPGMVLTVAGYAK